MKNDKYAAIKPLKNKFIKLEKILASFSHIEWKEHMLQNILKNIIDETEIKNIDNWFLFWVFERENEHNLNKMLF